MRNAYKIWIVLSLVILVAAIPISTYANYFTLPVDITGQGYISAWFDHDMTASTSMTKYTGEVFSGGAADLDTCDNPFDGSGCYDDHNGTDFATSTGALIQAPADGEVESVTYDTYNGWLMHIWHPDIGLSTLYAHIGTTTVATTTNTVHRGDPIAYVDSTGMAFGAHLHFGVTDGEDITTSHRIDPFGWWATTTDPWSYDQGYLWTTYPPSTNLASTTSGDIIADQTWRGNYALNGSVTVDSGVTLTISPGTIIKPEFTNTQLVVNGTLDAEGTTAHPIYVTSYKDDTVGGDTNNDGTSTPSTGDWPNIVVNSGASTTISHVQIKYGAANCCTPTSQSVIANNGGILSIFDTLIGPGNYIGLLNLAGTTTMASSTVHDNTYGLSLNGGSLTVGSSTINLNTTDGIYSSAGSLEVASSTFTSNGTAAYIPLSIPFTHWNNTASGSGTNGFYMTSNASSDTTWPADAVPYVVDNVTVDSGKTLTIDPGAIIKFANHSGLDVNGTLDAEGTLASPIYFTSLKDDSAGGDTNGDGASSGSAGDWTDMTFNTSASSTLAHVLARYGGYYSCCGGSGGILNNAGGILSLINTQVATSTLVGAYQSSGTTTASGSEFNGNTYGFYIAGGVGSATSSSFHNDSSYGAYANGPATMNFENNFWGASTGPNTTGADSVSSYIDYTPWLSSWP